MVKNKCGEEDAGELGVGWGGGELRARVMTGRVCGRCDRWETKWWLTVFSRPLLVVLHTSLLQPLATGPVITYSL